MIIQYIDAFIAVFFVSAVSLVGVFTLSLKEKVLHKYIFVFISLAVGALLGDAFIHIVPEAFAETSIRPHTIGILIIAGILLFFAVEKIIHWHHHGDDQHIHPVGNLVLFSDGLHNIIDGIIIGISFLVSIPLGMATTLAVILHEIPQEIGDFTVLLHAGYSIKKALWYNFLSALTAFIGLFIAFTLNNTVQNFIAFTLPITAGGFIYIALADLIPELQKSKEAKHSFMQIITLLVGVGAMLMLLVLE